MIFEISSPLFVFFTYRSAQCSSLRLLAFAIHEFEYATGATSPCRFSFWTPTAAYLYFLCTSFTVRFNSGGKQLLLKKIYFVSRSPGIFGGVLPSKVASSTYNLLLHTYSLTMDPIPLASLLFFIMILISFIYPCVLSNFAYYSPIFLPGLLHSGHVWEALTYLLLKFYPFALHTFHDPIVSFVFVPLPTLYLSVVPPPLSLAVIILLLLRGLFSRLLPFISACSATPKVSVIPIDPATPSCLPSPSFSLGLRICLAIPLAMEAIYDRGSPFFFDAPLSKSFTPHPKTDSSQSP